MATDTSYMDTPKTREEAQAWQRNVFLEQQRKAGASGDTLDHIMSLYDKRQNIEHQKDYGITPTKVFEAMAPGVTSYQVLGVAKDRFDKGNYFAASTLVAVAGAAAFLDIQRSASLLVPGVGEADQAVTIAAETGIKTWLGIGKAVAENAAEDMSKSSNVVKDVEMVPHKYVQQAQSLDKRAGSVQGDVAPADTSRELTREEIAAAKRGTKEVVNAQPSNGIDATFAQMEKERLANAAAQSPARGIVPQGSREVTAPPVDPDVRQGFKLVNDPVKVDNPVPAVRTATPGAKPNAGIDDIEDAIFEEVKPSRELQTIDLNVASNEPHAEPSAPAAGSPRPSQRPIRTAKLTPQQIAQATLDKGSAKLAELGKLQTDENLAAILGHDIDTIKALRRQADGLDGQVNATLAGKTGPVAETKPPVDTPAEVTPPPHGNEPPPHEPNEPPHGNNPPNNTPPLRTGRPISDGFGKGGINSPRGDGLLKALRDLNDPALNLKNAKNYDAVIARLGARIKTLPLSDSTRVSGKTLVEIFKNPDLRAYINDSSVILPKLAARKGVIGEDVIQEILKDSPEVAKAYAEGKPNIINILQKAVEKRELTLKEGGGVVAADGSSKLSWVLGLFGAPLRAVRDMSPSRYVSRAVDLPIRASEAIASTIALTVATSPFEGFTAFGFKVPTVGDGIMQLVALRQDPSQPGYLPRYHFGPITTPSAKDIETFTTVLDASAENAANELRETYGKKIAGSRGGPLSLDAKAEADAAAAGFTGRAAECYNTLKMNYQGKESPEEIIADAKQVCATFGITPQPH